MVSAWANSNQLVLGQVKTNEKSNETTAIPVLLDLLDLEDCIVTLDAMGCQKNISLQTLYAVIGALETVYTGALMLFFLRTFPEQEKIIPLKSSLLFATLL